MLVARTVHQSVRQVAPECGIEHPKVYPHARVGRICRGPVRRAATGRAVPKIERAIALLIRGARTHHSRGIGGAIVPKAGSAPAYRAVTLGRLCRDVAQNKLNSPAMAASTMLVHPHALLALAKRRQRSSHANKTRAIPHPLPPVREFAAAATRLGHSRPDRRFPEADICSCDLIALSASADDRALRRELGLAAVP